jgi:hypothetical protein
MEPLTLVALGVAAVVVALLVARRSVSPAPPQTGLLKPSIFKPTPEMKISVRLSSLNLIHSIFSHLFMKPHSHFYIYYYFHMV